MKAKIGLLMACLLLSACKDPGLKADRIMPANQDFYKDLPENFPLKGQVAVGDVTSKYEDLGWANPTDDVRPEQYKISLTRTLAEAKVLAQGAPRYVLNARIMDRRYPSFGTMHVTAGAAVAYELSEVGSQKEIFSKTITSTNEIKKGFFEEARPYMDQATANAFGENEAQLVRELAAVNPSAGVGAAIPVNKPNGVVK